MTEEQPQGDFANSLEWHPVAPKSEFYDNVKCRFFVNTTSENLLIGFGHNTRQLEIIAIAFEKDAVKREDPALKTLEGEVIEEEV